MLTAATLWPRERRMSKKVAGYREILDRSVDEKTFHQLGMIIRGYDTYLDAVRGVRPFRYKFELLNFTDDVGSWVRENAPGSFHAILRAYSSKLYFGTNSHRRATALRLRWT